MSEAEKYLSGRIAQITSQSDAIIVQLLKQLEARDAELAALKDAAEAVKAPDA